MKYHIRRICTIVGAIALLLPVAGCQNGFGSFKRTGVGGLQSSQKKYYQKLKTTLEQHKAEFKAGLTAQLAADQERRRKLLTWQRDMAKAEVLLQVPGTAKEKQELLLMKLTELDAASSADYHKLDNIDRDRLATMVALYDRVIEATDKLLANDAAIAQYLQSPNSRFIAESADIAAAVRVASAVRTLNDQLRGVAARSAEQRKKDDERLQKQLERAQQVIVNALSKKGS